METGQTHTNNASEARNGLSRLFDGSVDLREGPRPTILQQLLHAARAHLDMEVGFISEFREQERVFRFVDHAEGAEVIRAGDSDPLEMSYCRKVVDGDLPEVIHDAQALPEAQALPVTRELGIGAHVSVPIRLSDGTIYGTFCSFDTRPEPTLNERDRALMRMFSDLAAGLIEQDINSVREEQEKRNRIHGVLKTDSITMVWQPIVDVASRGIAGVECLARFPRPPERRPDQWFDEAASIGLADTLEARAIEKGLDILCRLPATTYITCNSSVSALSTSRRIMELLERLPLDRVVLEITEHAIIEDYAAVATLLAPLRKRGLRLAVDDAGAGYASFRHILWLKPDFIKLDMSLIRDINDDFGRQALVASLLRFVREMDGTMIAEGVETAAELATLERLGVENAQGYLFHKPLSWDDLRALLPDSP